MYNIKIEFRKAKVEDASDVARIYHDAYQENIKMGFPASAVTVETKEVENWIKNAYIFVSFANDEMVGAVRIMIKPEWDVLVLSRLGISSKWKGKGIASKLMDFAEQEAVNLGWDKIRLTTPINHPYLPNMYRRRGYKDIGVREFNDLPYDEVILEKEL